MQDSLLEIEECKDYVYLKQKLSGGSILSATIPAATLVVKCSAWCMLSLIGCVDMFPGDYSAKLHANCGP